MARSKGIVKFNGLLDGISFYTRDGKTMARIPNGPDKNKIQNSPNFKRTRENNQEFGGAANAGKALRVGLAQVYKHMSDLQGNARIVKLTKTILNKSDGIRGQRPFYPVPHAQLFHNFAFHGQLTFDNVFIAPISAEVNAERSQVSLAIPAFHTENQVNAPLGATHMRLVNVVSVLSAFEYNPMTKKYEAVDALNNSKNGMSATDFIPLDTEVTVPNTLVAQVSGLNGLLDSSALISCIGIEFYQELSGSMYLLATDNVMKIQAVY